MSGAVESRVRELLARGDLDLDPPGAGSTPGRLLTLCELARNEPISIARLAEAHTDALAILREAGADPTPGAFYGVWASQHPSQGVFWNPDLDQITGTMGFASGLGLVDRALVTARSPGGDVLLDVDVSDSSTVDLDVRSWSSHALADTVTGPITFHDHPAPRSSLVAVEGWYLRRVGFWQGSCAPAACWAGGALGVVDAAANFLDDDPHRRAHHGALMAHGWTLRALLDVAGTQIDTAPDSQPVAESTARSLRFAVATICRDVLDRFGRAFGPRPYVQDGAVAQRIIDLDLYIKQHHAERELPAISLLEAP